VVVLPVIGAQRLLMGHGSLEAVATIGRECANSIRARGIRLHIEAVYTYASYFLFTITKKLLLYRAGPYTAP